VLTYTSVDDDFSEEDLLWRQFFMDPDQALKTVT
jgi:hypothetical protein